MSTGPIVLFDGVCNLCNRSVQFILTHDSKQVFRFASLQSEIARRLLRERGHEAQIDKLDSLVLIEGENVHFRSTAALRIAARLDAPYSFLRMFLWVPTFVRNFFYDQIARTRYRFFGKGAMCWVMTPEYRARFLT